MRIVHISTSIIGGAGLAAFRLHETMLSHNLNSVLYSKNYENPNLSCIKIDAVKTLNFYKRIINYFKNKCDKYIDTKYNAVNFEYHSKLRTNYRLDNYCLQDDIIILHWAADFLDYKSFFNSIEKNTRIYIYAHDFNCIQGKLHTLYDRKKVNNKFIKVIEKYYRNKKLTYFNKMKNLNIIANSDFTKKILEESALFPNIDISKVYLGVPLNELKIINKTKARQELGFNEKDFLVLVSANNLDSELKGSKRFMTIYSKFKHHNRIKFIGLGKTESSTFLNSSVFYNYNTWDPIEKSILFSAADITLSTSYEESFGQTIIESYACATPVIVYSNAALPELVVQDKTGFIANNDNEVIDYINKLLNTGLHNKMTVDIKKLFMEKFTSQIQLRNLVSILNI